MEEMKFINKIRKRAGSLPKGVKLGIGDDCAVIEYSNTHYLLWASDMLVEDTHFILKGTPYEKIGYKAVSVNISDIAAMGGVPKYITINIGVPANMKETQIHDIYKGIFKICKDYKITVLGGDTNASDKFVISVSIMGLVEKKNLAKRSGAKKGDLVIVTGPVRNGKKEHLSFVPRLKEARYLTRKYPVRSMIDVSDGIAPDLGRICQESGVGANVYSETVPLSKGLSLEDALYYGESFELLFTMAVKDAKKLFKNMGKAGNKTLYFVIGEITEKKEGIKLVGKEGHVSRLEMKGFDHLG
ncbi:MAG: thiamine-phosphate kinase [Candidatus Omnitrophota bacterium]